MAEESAVKVCVRVRPLIPREDSAASENAEPVHYFWKADAKSIYQVDDGNSSKSFSFDRVFTAEETTNQLYQAIAKPLVVSSVQGYNGTIFAYGQTASGKTFTMLGSDRFPGVIPLAVEDVFQTIKSCPKKEFLLRVSYMEIYNETVSDLLIDSWKRQPLEVRETINKTIYVADLREELVTSLAQVLAWIRKGEKNRHYGKTKMNERSSRSHAIFRMILESRERSDPASGENADGAIIVSHLNLVDLAGSERASQTGAEGTRFKEGCNINRSLFTLGHVIKKLTDEGQKGFTNYRDSKLTRILQNSLGGNAKTVIICTITPVTLEETLSTLQFASTAKKMKNDPHVTEVSDEGALLKRYRNEIEDLKRRLQEVSSVTQTTAKEKKSLSQRLQEKDQLQTEQEDRIRNLTKLLVTSSNLVPVQKVPKRRETWGGKMQGLARTSRCDSFTGNRKADLSCLSELCESDKDFDAHWEIPDEPSDEMDMNQTSVTVRSFADSPKDFLSPDRMHELSERVSILMMQLEMETQQKKDALDKLQSTEQRAAQLELELQMEAEQKVKALEQVEILGGRLADIGSQNEDQSNTQMKKEFAETIHLCESLSTEKDMVLAERDYLKQELGMFIEQIEILEEEKALLSQELEEKREVDEFKALEDECRKDQENELQNEMANLKKTVEASELQCLDLQNKLQTLTVELKKKTEFALELQSMSGKDLVQEVEKLQRSLGDAEGLSRDTKKEWAVLRSEHMAVEEMNLILSANHEKMEAEVRSLRCKLDTEKTSFRKMQSDLQKELNVVFDENTKLTSLLDGKVPQNLIDSMELERRVAQLSRELTVSQEAEGELKAQLEELASFQTLPEKVDSLMKQLDELSEELQSVRAEKETLLSEQSAAAQSSVEEMEKLLSAVTSLTAERDQLQGENVDMAVETQIILQSLQDEMQQQRTKHSDLVKLYEQKESVLGEHMLSLSQELESVRAEKETLLSEQSAAAQSSAEEMEKLLSAVTSLTAERDQLQGDLQENVDMMIENQEELRTALEKNRQRRETIKQLENAQTSQQEAPPNETSAQIEELQTLMMENQEELRVSQEKVRVLQDEISALKSQKAELESRASDAEITLQLQELHNQIQTLSEELESVRAERDALLSERTPDTHSEEMETLQCRVTSLSEDRDQLQEILEGLRQEKQQLRDQLEDRMEMVAQAECEFNQPEILTSELHVAEVTNLQKEIKQLQDTLQTVSEQKSLLEVDLQRNMEKATETESLLHSLEQQLEEHNQRNIDLETLSLEQQAQLQQQVEETLRSLHSLQEELQEQKQHRSEHLKLCEQKESELDQQIKDLTEQLESVRAERDAPFVKETSGQSSTEEMEKLQSRVTSLSEDRDQLQSRVTSLSEDRDQLQSRVTSLSEDRDQLQETLVGLRQEKQQLRDQLEDRMEMIQTLSEELESVRAERDALLSERTPDTHSEEMEKLQSRVTSLSEDRDQLQETLEGLRQQKQQLRDQLEDRMETMHTEMATLNMSLQIVTEQKRKLEDDLQQNMTMASTTQELLKTVQEKLCEQQQMNSELDKLCSLDQQKKTLTDKLESIEAERDAMLSEKESSGQSSTEEMEKLQSRVTSLSEDRDQLQSRVTYLSEERHQLQETLEGLRQEKQQLRDQLEDRMEMIQTLSEELESVRAERDALLSERTPDTHSEEMETLQCRVTSLSEDRDQLQEILEGLRQEKQQLRDQLEDRMEMVAQAECEFNQPEILTSELHVEEVTNLQKEIKQLQDTLQTVSEQKSLLEVDLQRNMEKATETESLLHSLEQQLEEHNQRNIDLETLSLEQQAQLQQQVCCGQSSTEEMEKLQSRVTSLSEDRDQLQSRVTSLSEDRDQLQSRVTSLSEDRDQLQSRVTSLSEDRDQLQSRVTSLSEDRDQLQETLEGLRQQKQQLRDQLEDRMETMHTEMATLNMSLQIVTEQKRKLEDDLQQNMTMASTTQELLKTVQEKLCEQQQMNSELDKLCQQKESSLDQQKKTLTDKLESIEAERDGMLSEKESSGQSSTEEMEKLQSRVTSLSEERHQLQETLEGLRQEKQQLRDQLEDRMEMVSGTKEKLSEQEQLNSQLREQAERREQETQLQQRLLSDAITTMSVPREQLSSLDQSSSRVKETMTSQLQESTEQLQESFGKFQHFIDACSKYNTTGPVTVERCQFALTKAATQTYNCVYRLQQQAAQFVSNTMEHLKLQAQSYMKVFKELVRKDLAVFKERRALDELLCRVKAQTSVNDKDFHSLWDNQLTELLDKRQLYLQKMSSILGKLWACIASYPSELSTDNTDRECFKEKLQSLFSKPMNFFLMDSILSTNLVYLSELVHGRKMTLKGIVDEQDSLLGGLKLLEAQAEAQLTEERSKITCLLVLQLKQTQDKVKAVNEQLQEAQVKAGHRVSSHKQATQLLQTELQDSLAQVEEKEHAIQTLRSKLRESERKAPPSVVELEKLRSELFKREVEWTSASDKHKQEMQMMNTVLTEKDHSMRKLKQTLRSQQQGEESFLQGEDLHARLTNPRGLVIKSSVQLEKTKLEEEVKRLRLKVTELESLVSSQQAEISKWKSRALKLKGRVQAEVDKPSSPSTPTKRGYFMASDGANFFSSPKKIKVTPRKVLDSPRKVLDSPRKLLDSSKVSALDSPKSRFFDVGGNSELLSRSRPTQFFDNSSLGTTPASVADRRDDVWPLSPKQEEMCKSQ
ncbi:centromere-associated protein E isoform X3 [Trematomus bernacchii]|uniref:centromere-associated protein E isoform X3 n=1 Tax=Trematomus bernacchii TaxID=40690 RepID=UPI00146C157B|nr:centromere-associated protein E isoform X3 [Trematomus bernacchii]